MSDEQSHEYELIMPFWIDTEAYTDRDREMFVCGVEFEMLCRELMESGERVIRTIHTENESRARMAAHKIGRKAIVESCGDKYHGWSYFKSPEPDDD